MGKRTLSGIKYGDYILLHAAFFIYSSGAVFSKHAGLYDFYSREYFVYYGGVLAVMIVYAALWQQAIKRMPLNAAYANKAVTIVWGVAWGHFLWNDAVSVQQLAGVLIIAAGVVLVGMDNGKTEY